MDVAATFERGLSFYEREYWLQVLRGPGSPFSRLRRVRRTLDGIILGEISRRRREGDAGEDILGLLIEAEDSEGNRFTDEQVRDQVLTLLFAGHDTTTSTLSFLFYELSRHPEWASASRTSATELPGMRRRTPPSSSPRCPSSTWRCRRRSASTRRRGSARADRNTEFEFGGYRIPAELPVNYSSWASHRLPDVFDDPHAFRPERFAPEEKAKLPKGAYVPFGAGPRICIGMRFGELEIRAIAAAILRRFRLGLEPGRGMRIRQMPTLSPRGGLPMQVL